ncbi:MAG: trypsin-like serine peptidase [Dongiaceae bacterium]
MVSSRSAFRIGLLAGLAVIAAGLAGCETPARPPAEPGGPIPWTAAIGRLDAEVESTSCTATLVEPDIIVTAAHCIFPSGRKLSPGDLTFTPNVGAQSLPTVRVAEIVGLGVDKMDPEKPESTPTEMDWAILRLADPIANVPPIPVEAVALAEIDRRVQAGDILSNFGYGTYGVTISRRLHRSEGCKLIPEWRELVQEADDRLVITTCPVIKGDSGGPILITDKAENRRLVAIVSGFWRRPEPYGNVSLAVGASAFAKQLK